MNKTLFSTSLSAVSALAGAFLPPISSLDAADAPEPRLWRPRHPEQAGRTLRDIRWNGAQWTAVGGPGVAATSPDGLSWTFHRMHTLKSFHALTWTGTRWIAAGEAGALAVSADGRTWTVSGGGPSFAVRSLRHAGGRLVAAGAGGIEVAPVNKPGEWTKVDLPVSGGWRDLAVSPDRVVVVGEDGRVFSSPDGVEWEGPHSSGTSQAIGAVTWTGTRFAAAGSGYVAFSQDGKNWMPVTPPAHELFTGVTGENDNICLLSQNRKLYFGTPGGGWTSRPLDGLPAAAFTAGGAAVVSFANGLMVRCAGGNPPVPLTDVPVMWSLVAMEEGGGGALVASASGAFAGNSLMRSVDHGKSWHKIVALDHRANALARSPGGVLVAVGDQGSTARSTNGGASWSSASVSGTERDLRGVTWHVDRFIAAGAVSTLRSTTNGVTWKTEATLNGLPVRDLHAVTSNGVRAVATGGGGAVFYHDPAQQKWLHTTIAGEETLKSVTWGGGFFVCAGTKSLHRSPDGVTWTSVPGTEGMNKVVWTGTHFVAGGARYQDGYGRMGILYSKDGLAWEEAPSPGEGTVHSLVWTGREALAAGNYGAVMACDPSWRPRVEMSAQRQPLAPNAIPLIRTKVELFWEPLHAGDRHIVEWSEDLEQWTALPEVTGSSLRRAELGGGPRFYRVRSASEK